MYCISIRLRRLTIAPVACAETALSSLEAGASDPPESNRFIKGKIMRVCFTLQVRPEKLEEYKKRHAQVWPEMLDALRQTGWHNYSIFMREDGTMVGYLETEDFESAREAMKSRPVNARWQAEMAHFFSSLDSELADDKMYPLEEVFHLD